MMLSSNLPRKKSKTVQVAPRAATPRGITNHNVNVGSSASVLQFPTNHHIKVKKSKKKFFKGKKRTP